MTRLLVCFSFVLLLSSLTIRAQPQSYDEEWRWVHFTTESGLPSNDVSDVIETPDGVPWAATAGGLVWYDGFQWQTPKDTSLLPRMRPTWLAVDPQGKLLAVIGSRIYIGDTNRLALLDPAIEKIISTIYAVVPMEDQRYFIVGDNHLYSYARGRVERANQPGSIFVVGKSVFYTRGKGIWINMDEGIFRWDGNKWIQKLKPVNRPYELLDLVEDTSGRMRRNDSTPDQYSILYSTALGSVTCATTFSQGKAFSGWSRSLNCGRNFSSTSLK